DLVAGVAAALDRILLLERLAIAEAAEVHLPRLHMFHVVDARVDRSAGFQHERAQPALGELFRRPAAAHPRADDDGVVVVGLSHGGGPREHPRSAASASRTGAS